MHAGGIITPYRKVDMQTIRTSGTRTEKEMAAGKSYILLSYFMIESIGTQEHNIQHQIEGTSVNGKLERIWEEEVLT
jgi:hypothetical protein